jgi:hypothetical protein
MILAALLFVLDFDGTYNAVDISSSDSAYEVLFVHSIKTQMEQNPQKQEEQEEGRATTKEQQQAQLQQQIDDDDDKNDDDDDKEEEEKDTKKNAIPIRPLVVVVNGCSGSTAIGGFLRKLVAAHRLKSSDPDRFEFFRTGKNQMTGAWKNPFYHEIKKQIQLSGENRPKHEMMVESFGMAWNSSTKSNEVFIAKANMRDYKAYHEGLEYLNPTYYGVYRENTLRKSSVKSKTPFLLFEVLVIRSLLRMGQRQILAF